MKNLLFAAFMLFSAVAFSQQGLLVVRPSAGDTLGLRITDMEMVIPSGTGSKIILTNRKKTVSVIDSIGFFALNTCDAFLDVTDSQSGARLLLSKNHIKEVVKTGTVATVTFNGGTFVKTEDLWADVLDQVQEPISCVSAGGLTNGDKGEVTFSGSPAGSTITIDNSVVTNAKMANMAQSTIKGRAAGSGTGAPVDLTATQATAILNAMVGDSGSGGTKGLVPAPAAGDAAASKFLKADGTWAAVAGTSVAYDFLEDPNDTVAVRSWRQGGTATVLSNPGAGVYTLTPTAGAFIETIRIFGNSTTLNGSSEFVVNFANTANTSPRTFSVQIYDGTNFQLVDQQATSTVHAQTVSGATTTLTFPGMNGFGSDGFYVELR